MALAIDYKTGVSHAVSNILTFIPKLVAFLIIVIIGYFIAKLIMKVLTKILQKVGFDDEARATRRDRSEHRGGRPAGPRRGSPVVPSQ